MTGPRLYHQGKTGKLLQYIAFVIACLAVIWLLYNIVVTPCEKITNERSEKKTDKRSEKKTDERCTKFLADNFRAKRDGGQARLDDHLPSSVHVNALNHTPTSSTIEHNIHQMYKDDQLHSLYKECIQSWPRNHPQWKYYFWTDRDLRNLIVDHYPDYLELFDSYPHPLQKADAGRYFVLHYYGGVYADVDFQSLRPIDQYLRNKSCILAPEPEEQSLVLYNLTVLTTNSIMACAKGHPFLGQLIASLPAALRNHQPFPNSPNLDILYTTGPQHMHLVLEMFWRTNKSGLNVTRAPSADLVPTADNGQPFHLWCECLRRKHRMGSGQARACDRLKEAGWRIDDVSQAYTKHYWYHLGYEDMAGKRKTFRVIPLAEILKLFTVYRYEPGR